MKNNNYFEVIVGTFVLLCAGVFFFNSFKSAKIKTLNGYHITAKFDDAGGIEAGSDVKISGIKIGTVENNTLDQTSYRALLTLMIDNSTKLPLDSSAKIISAGLLGEKYIEITPGSEEELLKNDGEIIYTQSSANLEELLGKFIFGSDKKDENKNENEDK